VPFASAVKDRRQFGSVARVRRADLKLVERDDQLARRRPRALITLIAVALR